MTLSPTSQSLGLSLPFRRLTKTCSFYGSDADPKGSDCYEKFSVMQDCMANYPELYGRDEDDELAAAMDASSGAGDGPDETGAPAERPDAPSERPDAPAERPDAPADRPAGDAASVQEK